MTNLANRLGRAPITAASVGLQPGFLLGHTGFSGRPAKLANCCCQNVAPLFGRAARLSSLPRTRRVSLRVTLAKAQPDHTAVAEEAVSAASKVTLKYFRSLLDVETKSDTSPVTVADREAEAAITAVIKQHCPDHAILGEESGYDWPGEAGQAEYLWVIDPIDGTKSFITGKPLWGTLLALLHKGEPVLGIIDQPYTKERWIGVRGQPTTLNGKELHTKKNKDLSAAYLYATSPHMFEEEGFQDAWDRLRGKVRLPLYGCDCYAYGLLAAGHADLVAECDMKPYDYLAHVPIVQGAGGVITDWQIGFMWCPNILRCILRIVSCSDDPSSCAFSDQMPIRYPNHRRYAAKGGALKWQMLPSGDWVDKAMPGEVLAAANPELHAAALEALAFGPEEIDPSAHPSYSSVTGPGN